MVCVRSVSSAGLRSWLCVWLFGLLATPATAANVAWSVGWDGVVKLGRWSIASADFTLDESRECRLECAASDSDGHVAVFRGPAVRLPAGSHRVETPFQVGRPDAAVTVRLFADDELFADTVLRPDNWSLKLVQLSERLVVSLGEVRAVAALTATPSRTPVHLSVVSESAQLPTSPNGYDAVDALLLTGAVAISEAQSQAVRDWVGSGGTLIVSVPKGIAEFRSSPIAKWLPFQVAAEPVAVRDLGALEAYAGRNLRIPMTGRVTVADVDAAEGFVLASSRTDELLVRAPYGFGEVLALSLDLTQSPLVNWGGSQDLVRRLVGLEAATASQPEAAPGQVRGQLTSTGISDFASQLVACLDYFPAVRRPSPWWSMVWLLVALLIVGPLDYVLVHRVLKRPHYTWATLSLWLLLSAGWAAFAGTDWNRSAARLNQVDIVDIDTASQAARVSSYATYYSPDSRRVALSMSPRTAGWQTDAARRPTPRGLSWFSIPESTTGGLYRPGGVEWGRTEYHIEPLASQMTAVPVLQWSSRMLASRWSDDAANLVDSDLQSTGLGRLTGTLTHHLPGRVTDWMLAFGNRAYRLQVSRTDDNIAPLPAGRRLSAEDPLLFQGDLRSLLTRVVVTQERGKSKSDTRIRREQTKYDPSQRDVHRLWQVVTFHTAAGGTGYSSLHNELLASDDLTRQLDLGRAVLFGRLEAETWTETRVNGEALLPDRRDVLVRLVLPVRRSGEIVRELPKFEPEE